MSSVSVTWQPLHLTADAVAEQALPLGVPLCSLKSANVLLDKKYRAKLADVGLSKTLTHSYGCDSLATYMATGELGTFAWAAPEVIAHPRPVLHAWLHALCLCLPCFCADPA